MNELVKLLGMYYYYETAIRSLTPEDIKQLKCHSDAHYIRKVDIHLSTVSKKDAWKYRYGYAELYVWNYDVTVYG